MGSLQQLQTLILEELKVVMATGHIVFKENRTSLVEPRIANELGVTQQFLRK